MLEGGGGVRVGAGAVQEDGTLYSSRVTLRICLIRQMMSHPLPLILHNLFLFVLDC